jgi:hypothetical protein
MREESALRPRRRPNRQARFLLRLSLEAPAMKKNIAYLDRALRAGAGLFLLATPILNLETYPYNLFGIVLMATALVGFCPIYAVILPFVPKKHSASGISGTHGFGQLGGPHERPAR